MNLVPMQSGQHTHAQANYSSEDCMPLYSL